MTYYIENIDADFLSQMVQLFFSAIPVGVLFPPLFFLTGFVIKKAVGWLSRS